MTVLAYKDGILAADAQLTAWNRIERTQKIVRLPDGGMAAGCGTWHKAYAALKWLAEGSLGEPPNVKDCMILIIRGDGSVWFAEEEFPEYPVHDEFVAAGCGADAAKMAMRLGKSSVEAVQLVIGQDAFCGEMVQSMELVQLADFPKIVRHSTRPPPAKRAKNAKRTSKAR